MASADPPTEYFAGIDFNLSFYTEGDNSVTLNYVNNNVLKCVGYAYSRPLVHHLTVFYMLLVVLTQQI